MSISSIFSGRRIAIILIAVFAAAGIIICFAAGKTEKTQAKAPVPVTVRQLPENASYSIPALGITFPPVLAGYKKDSVTENANPVYGTVIRYAGETGEYADIYLYTDDTGSSPIREENLVREYEKTVNAILKGSAAGNEKKQEEFLPVKESISSVKKEILKQSGGRPSLYKCSFHCQIGDSAYESMLVTGLLSSPGETTAEKKNYARYFKLRLTRPSGVSTGEADAERFISALFRELGFSL